MFEYLSVVSEASEVICIKQSKSEHSATKAGGEKKSHKPSIFDHLISIQMISSGICGSDDHMLKGELLANFPLIPGHEGAGIVESVGDGVCSVKPGRRWEMGFSSEQLA